MSNDDSNLRVLAQDLRAQLIVNLANDLNFKFIRREKPHIYNNLSLKDKVLLRT